MRLEFEPSIAAIPPVVNEAFEAPGFGHPSDLETILKRGIEAAQNGDRESARKHLSLASALDPNCEDAWMWLASISEYPEELLAFLDRVLSINPDNQRAIEWREATRSLLSKTFAQRASAALEQGSAALAERCLEQALDYDGNNAAAWYLKALISADENEKLELFARALDADPDHEDAAKKIAEIHSARAQADFAEAKNAALEGDHDRASELLDAYLKEDPRSVEAWILKSHLSTAVERKIEALEKALEIDPENTAARSGLAFLALTFGSSKDPASDPIEMALETSAPEPLETVVEEQPIDTAEEPFNETPSNFSPADTSEGFSLEPVEDPIAPQPEAQATDTSVAEEDEPSSPKDEVEPLAARSAEEMFGSVEPLADPEHETVESLDPFATIATNFDETEPGFGQEMPSVGDEPWNPPVDEAAQPAFENPVVSTDASCPFCHSNVDEQAFECGACHAPLTLSDLEALLNVTGADRETIQTAVTQMEAEWNLRELTVEELTFLSIGHFCLRNLESGLRYLQEASRLDPNDVVLAGKVNALAIRLDEIQRQNEIHESQPTGKTILVVDDSATVRKLISGKLEKSGHVVICACDGVEALEKLEDIKPDLVLLDITMPRMDGYEVCKQIRSNPDAKDLPVVMISGKDGFFDKVRGRMAGSTGYVTKPFGPETLMKALETYLLPDA